MNFLLILTVLFLRADTFSHFTYCHETTRGLYELQCADLDSSGKGLVQFKRRAGDPIKLAVTLSPAARDRFLSILEATNYLDQADTYEAPRKVADLGKKRVTIELTSGA